MSVDADPPVNEAAMRRDLAKRRQAFEMFVAELRPELHRYCTRILGSAAEGEDAVQQVLAAACYRLPLVGVQVPLRRWLLSLAHHHCLQLLATRRDGSGQADTRLASTILNELLGALPPSERAAVVLKDVLDFPLAQIASTQRVDVGAVKSALHRGRRKLNEARHRRRPPISPDRNAQLCERYAAAMRGRDLNRLRAIVADGVQVEIVGRRLVNDRDTVERDYLRPQMASGDLYRLLAVDVDGRRQLLRVERRAGGIVPHSLISIDCFGDTIHEIRDYFHVPYLIEAMAFDDVLGVGADEGGLATSQEIHS